MDCKYLPHSAGLAPSLSVADATSAGCKSTTVQPSLTPPVPAVLTAMSPSQHTVHSALAVIGVHLHHSVINCMKIRAYGHMEQVPIVDE